MDFVNDENLTLYRYDLSKEKVCCLQSLISQDSLTDHASPKHFFSTSGEEAVDSALRIILDTRNHPLLIHDDSGKSTATLICSLIRRMQGWSLTGIFAEGDMFSGPAGGAEGGGVGEPGREVGFSCCQIVRAG